MVRMTPPEDEEYKIVWRRTWNGLAAKRGLDGFNAGAGGARVFDDPCFLLHKPVERLLHLELPSGLAQTDHEPVDGDA